MEETTTATVGSEVNGTHGATENSNGAGQETIGAETKETKTYTEEDFNKALQSETDKRVQEALKTAKEKWKSEYENTIKAERDEAARLAKMSAEERAEAERQKEREKFESEREQYKREKLEFETGKQLADKGLSPKFASFLTQSDAESTKTNIEAFETAFNEAVNAAVTERLKGTTPKAGTTTAAESDPFLAGFAG